MLGIIIGSSNHGGFPPRGSCFCLWGCLVREQHAWDGGKSKVHFNVIYGHSELVWRGQAIEGLHASQSQKGSNLFGGFQAASTNKT